MIKCKKCGKEPQDTDKLAWKCNSCGKAFGVKLSSIQKLQEKKNAINAQSLLRCKECGEYLDNGNEKIFWKCSCGNVQSGGIEDYVGKKFEKDEEKNTNSYASSNDLEYQRNTRRIIVGVILVGLLSIILIIAFDTCIRKVKIEKSYQFANEEYNKENYSLAKKEYKELGNYKDSYKKIKLCDYGLTYNQAMEIINDGNIEKGLDLLLTLPSDYNNINNIVESEAGASAIKLSQEGELIKAENLLKKYDINESKYCYPVIYNRSLYCKKNKDYFGEEEALLQCKDYKDAEKRLKLCYYNCAISKMKIGELEEAIEYLNKINGKYKNKKQYMNWCKKYLIFTTEWVLDEPIDDDNYDYEYFYFNISLSKKGKLTVKKDGYPCKVRGKDVYYKVDSFYDYPNRHFDLSTGFLYTWENGETEKYALEWEYVRKPDNYFSYDDYLEREEEFKNLPERPVIGMTEEEARNTQWGEPEDTNTTVTRYGTHKQLCFENYRYAYIDNGYVTSVQY